MNDLDPAAQEPHENAGQGPAEPGSADLHDRAIKAVQTVYDPEIPVDIYQLGLIYEIKIEDPGDRLRVTMTLTSPTCPAAGSLPGEVQTKLQKLEGVTEVKVDLTWEPPWSPDMMSEAAKLQLGVM